MLAFAIQKSDMDLRRVLYSNIVLSGGSTLFKGNSVKKKQLLYFCQFVFVYLLSDSCLLDLCKSVLFFMQDLVIGC